jgi:penicillin-binding protein 2
MMTIRIGHGFDVHPLVAGRKCVMGGVDIPFEKGGGVPDSNYYNKLYRGVWNSCTVVFVGMGQGELLLTPLQMANSMCIIANKGYYYTPHFVKSIGKNANDPMLYKFKQKKVVLNIPNQTFDEVQSAMQDVVESGLHSPSRLIQLFQSDRCPEERNFSTAPSLSSPLLPPPYPSHQPCRRHHLALL